MSKEQTRERNNYVINTNDEETGPAEVARLDLQGKFVTRRMAPLLHGSLSRYRHYEILDVACGTGEWIMRVAQEYPRAKIIGVDYEPAMLDFARAQAEAQQRSYRVSFQEGNVMKPLEFADNSFDYVNARFLQAVLDVPSWPGFVKECYRITKPGGYIRFTEGDSMNVAGAPLTHRFQQFAFDAMKLGKRCFSEYEYGLSAMLSRFLENAGVPIESIEEYTYPLNCSYGHPLHKHIVKNFTKAIRNMRPFLLSTGSVNETEFETFYRQLCEEFNAEDFTALWFIYSIIARKPA